MKIGSVRRSDILPKQGIEQIGYKPDSLKTLGIMYYTIQPHCLKADPWVLCSISIEFYPTFFDLSAFFPSDGFPQMLDETQVKAWFQNQQ